MNPRREVKERMRQEIVELRRLLSRWQGAMRFSGVAAYALQASDDNPLAPLIRETDAALEKESASE